MHAFLKHFNAYVSQYSHIFDRFCSLGFKHPKTLKTIHAQLLKLGLNTHTFLGNRTLDLYGQLGTVEDVLRVFDDIVVKNCISWNLCLKGLFRFGFFEKACVVFDEMPVRDVVSWNSMMSGCLSLGLADHSLKLYLEMRDNGVRPNQYTFSILTMVAENARHGKQIHGFVIRNGAGFSNVVVGNSLISMYGRLGLVDYAFGVFVSMESVDVISWNAFIWGCYRSGNGAMALYLFQLMRDSQCRADEFTISTVLGVCCEMRDLDKGTMIVGYCFKVGYFRNGVVSSAAIDLFSKCNRLENAVRLFTELDRWDCGVCNSMISGYARYGLLDSAMGVFVLMLREDLRPTEFTFSSVLSSVAGFLLADQGTQIHSLIVRTSMDSDSVVGSSLVDMYSKAGLVDCAVKIFSNLAEKDLISWNTMITGLARNGCASKALVIFNELLANGSPIPDRITLTGVLSACNHGNLVDEGLRIFWSMEKEFGITPEEGHYVCVVDLLSRVGELERAMDIVGKFPYGPSSSMWGLVLSGCLDHKDLKLAERVAETMMDFDLSSTLPYLVLARVFESSGKWDSAVRIRKAMRQKCKNDEVDCSWIGVRNRVYSFEADQLLHHRGKEIYIVSKLLFWQMKIEGYM